MLHQYREARLQRQIGLVDVEAEHADASTLLLANQQQRRFGRAQDDVRPSGGIESSRAGNVHTCQRHVG